MRGTAGAALLILSALCTPGCGDGPSAAAGSQVPAAGDSDGTAGANTPTGPAAAAAAAADAFCSTQPDGTACDDGSACTEKALCFQKLCYPVEVTTCSTLDACGLPNVCDFANKCPGPASGPCTAAVVEAPLSGCPSSDYWLDLEVGDKQTLQVLVDSGSTTLALVSSLCGSSCAGLEPRYTPGAKAADQHDTSGGTYGDGSSFTGEVFRDQVSIAGLAAPVAVDFVAISQQSNFIAEVACTLNGPASIPYQGLLGLGPTDLEDKNTNSFLANLAATNAVKNVFAVQLCNRGGRFWLGGFDPNFVAAAPQFVPMDLYSVFYAVDVLDLSLGSTSLGFGTADFGPMVIDTGTTALVLPQEIFNALTTKLNQNANVVSLVGQNFFGSEHCVKVPSGSTTAHIDATLPSLSFSLPRTQSSSPMALTLPATQSYLTPYLDTNGALNVCGGLEAGDPIGGSTPTIFGNAAMQGLVVIVDPGANQVGFAPSTGCPTRL